MNGRETEEFPTCHPLRAGQRVYLETPAGDEAVGIITEASAGQILLRIPATPTSSLQNGDEILVKYWEKGFVYCWEARVVEIPASVKDTLKVALEKKGLTVQRRKALRVRLTVDFSFLVTDAQKEDLVGERRQGCKTRNVSTTGLKFETDVPLSSGDKLAITLELPQAQKVNAYAWVVRSDSVKDEGDKRRLVAVEFLQLEEADQQTLFRFIGGVVSQQD